MKILFPITLVLVAASLGGCTCGGGAMENAFKGLAKSAAAAAAAEDKANPGKGAFMDANGMIFTDTDGVAHGNSDEAKTLAATFSKTMAAWDKEAFTGGKKNRILSLSGDHFVTYCRHDKHKTAFLVHVPQLKRYTKKARAELLDGAFNIAQKVVIKRVSGLDFEDDSATERVDEEKLAAAMQKLGKHQLGVGLRGALLYGAVARGPLFDPDGPEPTMSYGLKATAKQLYSFFVDDEQDSAVQQDSEQKATPKPPTAPAAAAPPKAGRS